MPAKVYLRIIQGGLAASLLIVFFVFKDLLFPYITSKQLPFNILIEFLFALWLLFILRYPEYRPKRNYITWGLLAYFLAILISCAVSVDFGLSFWGDAERMLGLFHLLHFLAFYLILITVLRSWRDWRMFLLSSVLVATAVSLIGLNGPDVYATIGNTAYVSGYLIFNIFFCLLLFLRGRAGFWHWLYIIPAIIMLMEFWSCHTSGAIIGLLSGLLLLFFLLGLLHGSKNLRRFSLILFGIGIIVILGVFSQSRSSWFQNSFLKNLSSQKATFQTRLISWQGAAADFKYHPFLGTGFGNYAIIFDKHFDSKFFNYSKTETYFDRAHNNLIDIVSTTGLIGLLAYLSIFIAALYYLRKDFKANGPYAGAGEEASRRNLEILVIVGLLAAYFIQNLAVFDSYVTYIGLMIVLGFIYWLSYGQADDEDEDELPAGKSWRLPRDWEFVVMVILLIATGVFANYYNARPWRMFVGVIGGYDQILSGNFPEGVTAYKKALVGTPLDHDGRVTLINIVTSSPSVLGTMFTDTANETLDYIIDLAEKNVAENPQDSLTQMQLAQLLDTTARFNLDKFEYYSDRAIAAIDRSIAASPGRAPVYFVKAQMQLVRGEKEEAIKTIKYGISLNPDYSEGYCRLAQFYLFLKDAKNMPDALNTCVDRGGVDMLNSDALMLNALKYYSETRDYPRAVKVSERLAALNSREPQIWFNLAKLYLVSGDMTKAQAAADRAATLDAKLKDEWTGFLKSFQAMAASSSPATTTGGKK